MDAGADFDSSAPEVTEWYRRTDEDGRPVAYDYARDNPGDEQWAELFTVVCRMAAVVGAAEHEADDVIGTLATAAGMPVGSGKVSRAARRPVRAGVTLG